MLIIIIILLLYLKESTRRAHRVLNDVYITPPIIMYTDEKDVGVKKRKPRPITMTDAFVLPLVTGSDYDLLRHEDNRFFFFLFFLFDISVVVVVVI